MIAIEFQNFPSGKLHLIKSSKANKVLLLRQKIQLNPTIEEWLVYIAAMWRHNITHSIKCLKREASEGDEGDQLFYRWALWECHRDCHSSELLKLFFCLFCCESKSFEKKPLFRIIRLSYNCRVLYDVRHKFFPFFILFFFWTMGVATCQSGWSIENAMETRQSPFYILTEVYTGIILHI